MLNHDDDDVCLPFSVKADLFRGYEKYNDDDVLCANVPKWRRFAERLGEQLGKEVSLPQAITQFVYAMEDGAIEAVAGHWRGSPADPEVLDAVMAFIDDKCADLADEVLADPDCDEWDEELGDDRWHNVAYFVEHDDPSSWLLDYFLYDADGSFMPHINFENVPQWIKLAERLSERHGRQFSFANAFELFMTVMAADVFQVQGNVWRGCVHSDEVASELLEYMKTMHPHDQEQLVEPNRWAHDTAEYARCKELGLTNWRPPRVRDQEFGDCEDGAEVAPAEVTEAEDPVVPTGPVEQGGSSQ
jgi:hypothetical protein